MSTASTQCVSITKCYLCTSRDGPHIDGNGACAGILLPNIPEDVLEQYKQELLAELESR